MAHIAFVNGYHTFMANEGNLVFYAHTLYLDSTTGENTSSDVEISISFTDSTDTINTKLINAVVADASTSINYTILPADVIFKELRRG